MWISFGVGKQCKYIPIHDIVRALKDEKAQAFTGCDRILRKREEYRLGYVDVLWRSHTSF